MLSPNPTNLLTSIPYGIMGELATFHFQYPDLVTAKTAFGAFTTDVEKTLELLAAALRGKHVHLNEFPDLREDYHVLVQSGDPRIERYALVNVEADRIVNSLNTLREQVIERVRAKEVA